AGVLMRTSAGVAGAQPMRGGIGGCPPNLSHPKKERSRPRGVRSGGPITCPRRASWTTRQVGYTTGLRPPEALGPRQPLNPNNALYLPELRVSGQDRGAQPQGQRRRDAVRVGHAVAALQLGSLHGESTIDLEVIDDVVVYRIQDLYRVLVAAA